MFLGNLLLLTVALVCASWLLVFAIVDQEWATPISLAISSASLFAVIAFLWGLRPRLIVRCLDALQWIIRFRQSEESFRRRDAYLIELRTLHGEALVAREYGMAVLSRIVAWYVVPLAIVVFLVARAV